MRLSFQNRNDSDDCCSHDSSGQHDLQTNMYVCPWVDIFFFTVTCLPESLPVQLCVLICFSAGKERRKLDCAMKHLKGNHKHHLQYDSPTSFDKSIFLPSCRFIQCYYHNASRQHLHILVTRTREFKMKMRANESQNFQ